jgi:hypothetical protein
MRYCERCAGPVDHVHRFCPWCALPQRRKTTELFPGHPELDPEKALRVSRYLDGGHTRFSVWGADGRAEAVVSIDEAQAGRLARYLLGSEDATRRLPWSESRA